MLSNVFVFSEVSLILTFMAIAMAIKTWNRAIGKEAERSIADMH